MLECVLVEWGHLVYESVYSKWLLLGNFVVLSDLRRNLAWPFWNIIVQHLYLCTLHHFTFQGLDLRHFLLKICKEVLIDFLDSQWGLNHGIEPGGGSFGYNIFVNQSGIRNHQRLGILIVDYFVDRLCYFDFDSVLQRAQLFGSFLSFFKLASAVVDIKVDYLFAGLVPIHNGHFEI